MTAARNSRIVGLDLTKGVLVLCMVIYHSLNYSTDPALGFRYFSFLPPSFIIITGFLISKVYLERESAIRSRTYLRLLFRGARLFVLFTLLNVAAQLFVHERGRGRMPGLAAFFHQWYGVFVTGNGRMATFEVLLPIAYFLIIAPLLMMVARWRRLALPVLAAAIVAAVGWTSMAGEGWASVQLVTAGVLGMAAGCYPIERYSVTTLVQVAALVAYAVNLAVALVDGTNYLNQIFGACLALVLIFGFCEKIPFDSWVGRRLELLGRYSLVAYIIQIVIICAAAHRLGRTDPLSPEFMGLFAGALVLTQATAEILNAVRNRSKVGELVYSAVFA